MIVLFTILHKINVNKIIIYRSGQRTHSSLTAFVFSIFYIKNFKKNHGKNQARLRMVGWL